MDGFRDIIKFQVMSAAGVGTGAQSMWAFVILLIVEELMKIIPKILDLVRHYAAARAKSTFRALEITDTKTHSIVMEYVYDDKQQHRDDLAEAVLGHITTSTGVTDLRYVIGRYLVNFEKPFVVAQGIQCKIMSMNVDQSKNTMAICLKLFSETKTTQELRTFVDTCHDSYMTELRNKLGDNMYMFDQASSQMGQMTYDAGKRHVEQPGRLQFNKHLFTTNRTLDNIFFEQRDAVKARMDFFLHKPDWYAAKGVPYTLGLLLHGSPGCGKSSTVKAVANIARRHIVNVNMATVKTKAQLVQLFYDDVIHVIARDGVGPAEAYSIPIHKRLYVLEDIDCMADIVLDRAQKKATKHKDDGVKDPVTLSDLLNVLDGVLETPGRILIMTTNFVDKLDKALIRPGRIDLIVEFKKASRHITVEMYESFFDRPFPPEMVCKLPDYARSPAEVSAVLFRHFSAPERAVEELLLDIIESPKDLVEFLFPEDLVESPEDLVNLVESPEDRVESPEDLVKSPEDRVNLVKSPEEDTKVMRVNVTPEYVPGTVGAVMKLCHVQYSDNAIIHVRGVHYTPVIERKTLRLVGVITYSDLARLGKDADNDPIKNHMTSVVISLKTTTSIAEARGLVGRHLATFPVVDEEGRVQGIVDRTDILHIDLLGQVQGDDQAVHAVNADSLDYSVF